MNFKFNEDEQKVLDIIHEFGVNEVAPLAAEIDEQERFPEENRKRLAELGMMGICYPKEYGGGGHSYLAYIAVIEELAKHCSTTSVMLSDHHSLGSFPISEFGTEEQKQKYLVPLLKGEKLGAFAVTEPSAGSDLGNQQTTAVDKGDYWLLNGTKIFITNGFYADTYFVTAMTDKCQRSRGISAFIVEKGTPGFTFGTKEKKMGIRGSATYELVFQGCKIPKENLLGELGKGFKMALMTLDGGRIGVAAQALGIAQNAIDHCKKYVTEHMQGEQRISQYQYTQFELADMQARVDAARLLVYRAAQAKQDHEPFSHLAAMGKLYAAEAATNVTRRCLQLVGYEGYSRDLPFERLMRDAKITEIYEGTSEVQRMVISSWMGVKQKRHHSSFFARYFALKRRGLIGKSPFPKIPLSHRKTSVDSCRCQGFLFVFVYSACPQPASVAASGFPFYSLLLSGIKNRNPLIFQRIAVIIFIIWF